MALTKKQKELDVIKWNISCEQGKDACGTFDYCEKCNKNLENPCDKAYKKFNGKKTSEKENEVACAEAPKKCGRKKKTSN